MAAAACDDGYHYALYLLLSISSLLLPALCFFSSLAFTVRDPPSPSLLKLAIGGVGCFLYAQTGPGQTILSYPCWARAVLGVFVVPLIGTNLVLALCDHQENQGKLLLLLPALKLIAGIALPFVVLLAVVLGVDEGNILTTVAEDCEQRCAPILAETIVVCVVSGLLLGGCLLLWWRRTDPVPGILLLLFASLALLGYLLGQFGATSDWAPPYDSEIITTLSLWLFVAVQTLPHLNKSVCQPPRPDAPRSDFLPSSPHTSAEMTRVLSDPQMTHEFHRFLEQEMSAECLDFLQATDKWKQQYDKSSVRQRQEEARRICLLYLTEGATSEINVSYQRAMDIRVVLYMADVLLKDNATVAVSVFDGARQEVEDLLQYGPFARYLEKQQQQPHAVSAQDLQVV